MKIDYTPLLRNSWTNQEKRNVELVGSFVQTLMNDHNFELVLQEFGNPLYKQHNRSIPDGIPNLIQYVKGLTKQFPEYAYDVKRITADEDYVTFHSHITMKNKDRGNERKGFNAIDTWRIEDGQIAEHWDALQPLDPFLRFYFWIIGGKISNANGVF